MALNKDSKNYEKGNVLFLILIAVALFAALSYVVTSSTRTSPATLSEKDRMAAGEILNYVVAVRTSIQRMLISGVPTAQLSEIANGRNAINGAPYTYADNANCTKDKCRVFHPAGGAAIYRNFSSYAMPPASYMGVNDLAPGENDLSVINVEGLGTDANDLAIRFILLNNSVCNAINVINNEREIFDWSVQTGSSPGRIETEMDSASVYHYSGDAAGKAIIPVGGPEGCYLYAIVAEL